MIPVLWVLGGIAYAVVALWWMRYWYGRLRAASIDAYPTLGAEYFEKNNRGMTMSGAVWAGLFWWFSIPAMGCARVVRGWLMSTPVVSQTELKEQHAAMVLRIEELEAEKREWEAGN